MAKENKKWIIYLIFGFLAIGLSNYYLPTTYERFKVGLSIFWMVMGGLSIFHGMLLRNKSI